MVRDAQVSIKQEVLRARNFRNDNLSTGVRPYTTYL